jgi:hypothetical protein
MGWVVNTTPWLLYPWERDPVPIVQEAGWAPGPVWTGAENSPPPRFNPWTIQSIVSRYTDYTILAHEDVFLPGKSCPPSSACTGTWCFAVPRHWHNGSLAGLLSKYQRGDNLMFHQECGLYGSTVHPKFVKASGAHPCMQWSIFVEEQHFRLFSCGANTKKLNARLRRVHHTRKMAEVLNLHENTRPHTSVHTAEAITNFGWTLLLHTPCSPDLAPSDYHLFGPFCEDTIMPWGTEDYCALLAAEEIEQLLLVGNTYSCSKVKYYCWQRWRLHWKIAVSNVIVQFCETVTCLTCK